MEKTKLHMNVFDQLPPMSSREAYEVLVDFIRTEFALAGPSGDVHLGGLLAELQLDSSGQSGDPGAVLQFADSVHRVLSRRSAVAIGQ